MNFATGLQLLFIGLKLGNVIDWDWWLVMSPIIITWGLGLLFVLSAWIVQACSK